MKMVGHGLKPNFKQVFELHVVMEEKRNAAL